MFGVSAHNSVKPKVFTSIKLKFVCLSFFMALLSIIPFYSVFMGDRLIYIAKYLVLGLFIISVINLTKESKVNIGKVTLLFITLFFVSSLNSFYIVNNLGITAFAKTIGSTLLFCSVGVLSVFYFSKIPFDKFKEILLVFLFGIFLFVNIPNIMVLNNPLYYYTFDGRERFFGVFQNSNEMSRFALLGYLLAIRLWLLYKGVAYKFLFLLTAISSAYLIYLSDSRASILIVGLSLAAIAATFIYKYMPIRLLISIICFILAGVFSILLYFLLDNYSTVISIDWVDASSGRFDIWQNVFNVDFTGLLFGVGSLQDVGIHNGYIEIIKYYGIVGFVVWGLLLSIITLWKVKNTFMNRTTSNLMGLAIVFMLLFYHMFEGSLVSLGNLASVYLWLEISQKGKT